jgi:IS30 family transposase
MSTKPWERQRGESQKSYEAFSIYRDMGATRSIQKVAQKLTKSDALLRRWSSKWNWVERAKEYDAEIDRQYLLEQEEERKKMSERHAKQAMMFQNKILERLRTIDPNRLSPADLIRWFDIAVKIERLARGESTVISSVEKKAEVVHHDVTSKIEKYAGVYEKLADRSFEGDDASDDFGE